MKKLILIGDSGHAKVIKEIAHMEGYEIIAILDDKYDSHLDGEIYYSKISEIKSVLKELKGKIIIAIGNNEVRSRIIEQYHLTDEYFVSLISPLAYVSPTATIDKGTVIMTGAIVNADAKIGRHVIINSSAVIEHDTIIGDFSHISPNATMTGGSKVGKYVHLGANAVLNPLVQVGDNSIIISGSSVTSNIPNNSIAGGVPAMIQGENK